MKGMGLFSSAIRGEAHPVKIIKNNKKTLFMPVYGKPRTRASYLAIFRSLLVLAYASYLAFFRSLLITQSAPVIRDVALEGYVGIFFSSIENPYSLTSFQNHFWIVPFFKVSIV